MAAGKRNEKPKKFRVSAKAGRQIEQICLREGRTDADMEHAAKQAVSEVWDYFERDRNAQCDYAIIAGNLIGKFLMISPFSANWKGFIKAFEKRVNCEE